MSGRGFRIKYTYGIDRAEDKRRAHQYTDEAGPAVERGERLRVPVLFRSTAIRRQLHNIAADELESVFFSGTRRFECDRSGDKQGVSDEFEAVLDGRPRDHGQRQC